MWKKEGRRKINRYVIYSRPQWKKNKLLAHSLGVFGSNFSDSPIPNLKSCSLGSMNGIVMIFMYWMGSPHVCYPNLLRFDYPQPRWRCSLQPLPHLYPGWVPPSGQSTDSDKNSRRGTQCRNGIGQPSWTLVAFASSQVTRAVKSYTRGMLSAAEAICLCMSSGRSDCSKEGYAVCHPCDIQQGKLCTEHLLQNKNMHHCTSGWESWQLQEAQGHVNPVPLK